MKFRLGEMSVGDILDRGLKVLFGRFLTFFTINLVVQSPLIAFQLLSKFSVVNVGWMVSLAVTLLLFMILTFVGMAAAIKVIEQEHIGRKIGIGEALGFALTRFLPLLAVSIIFGLVVFAGSILFLIPGLIFACKYAFSGQAVVLEGVGPMKGMNRSEKLTRGYKWRIFGIYCLIVLLSFGLGMVLGLVFPAGGELIVDGGELRQVPTNETNQVIQVLVNALLGTLINTYGTICLTLAYFDLRTRKEGFDLELAAQGLEQKSRKRFADDEDDDRDDRRSSRSRARDDDDDDRPRRKRDDDDDDRPRRRRDEDDDDRDERRPRRRD